MKKSIFVRAFNRDVNVLRALYVIILFSFIGISFYCTLKVYDDTGAIVSQKFFDRDSLIRTAIMSDTSRLVEVGKLKEQYRIIEPIKAAFLYNAVHFNAFGYSFTIFFAILGIITAILAFLLLRNGWEGTNNYYLKASFMVVFFSSTLFKILPEVFDNKTNTKNNLSKYNYYFGLQVHIYDLVKDNQGYIKRGHPDSLNNFISTINKNIAENQDLYFDIYTDKIPSDIKLPFGK
jgi:hypothetical protein